MKALLFFTILTMTALPLMAALYFLDDALETSLNLGFNPEIVTALETSSQNLKTLKNVDPKNEPTYRGQFEKIESLKSIYSKPELVHGSIRTSLKIYFMAGLLGAILLSVVIAAFLSQKISRSYQITFDELTEHREQVRYLEEISSWQEFAKFLAHEIKNPLTPIEVLVTSLKKAYATKSPADFQAQLTQTEGVVSEEIHHLKQMVGKFSEFAKVPQVQLTDGNLAEVLTQNMVILNSTFTDTELRLSGCETPVHFDGRFDRSAIRQVCMNIIRNGIEANPGRQIHFDIVASTQDHTLQLQVSNDGQKIPDDLAPRIFDPYISSKSGKDNMGLGLAIVKKIIIEHGGDITYSHESGRPTFIIRIRRSV